MDGGQKKLHCTLAQTNLINVMEALKQQIDKIEAQYAENLQKVAAGSWTYQQWYDFCTVALGDLMVFQYQEKTKKA
jgi:hypothetical protein